MRGATSTKWAVSVAALALVATACGSGGGGSDSGGDVDPNGTFSYQSNEPQNPLQPANANEVGGGRIMDNLFTGLTYFGQKGDLKMGAAKSVETKDSKHFTVKLKHGWTFHNGEPMTARSFVHAWNWGANTENAQINSSWFEDIKGYDDVHPDSGKPTKDKMSGLKVKDKHTFTIDLSHPVAYFKYKLGYVAFSPLPKAFYDDPKAFGQKPIGNGPYKFVSWKHNTKLTTKTYKKYKGPNKPKNGGVTFKFYPKPDAAYQDLQSGSLDTLDQVDPSDLGHYKQDLGDRAVDKPISSTQSIGFAMYDKKWDGKDKRKVRKGLSMAIDRATIGKTVLHGSREPATSFVAPGAEGYKANILGEAAKFKPKKAKKLVKEGGGVPGNKITVLYNSDGGHKAWVDAVCNSIKKATGVKCTGNPKPDMKTARDLITSKKLKANQTFRTGWQADYPHNATYLADVFRTGAASNDSGYSNKKFDKLTKEADAAKSPEESAKLYQKAEKILARDLPNIPLWYYKSNAGWSTNVQNVKYDWIGQPVWTDVEVKKK